MKKLFILLLAAVLLLPAAKGLFAGDLTFDSFEEAEAAAQKRSAEYNQKMNDHLKQVNEDWEKQQKDLGESGASPDITKITSSSDGEKSSSNNASKGMEDAVNSSVNKLKDTMINTAAPNTTGFAGGGAGYQWSVKFKNGKYVLSDSYNEAAFGTGDKRAKDPEPAAPPTESTGSDEDSDTAIAAKPTSGTSDTPEGTDSSSSTSSTSPSTTKPADVAATPSTPTTPAAPTGETPSSTTKPTTATKPADKPAPGIDPAPTKLPEPAVRMVIQHPTDFSEEVFSSNANGEESLDYELKKFKIPEDTRVKISLELSKDVNPNDVSLIVTDEEGDGAPVSSSKMKNYRHLFRVPSDDKYSARVVINDKAMPGSGQRQLMKVKIPVVKVEFDSRTIDGQKQNKGSDGTSSSNSSTSYSGSDSNFSHSSFGKPQQVDLSDLYSEAGSSTGNSEGANSGSSSGNKSSNVGSSGNSNSNGSNGSNGGTEYASNSSSGSSNPEAGSGHDGSSADSSEYSSSDNSSSDSSDEASIDGSDEEKSNTSGSSSDSKNANTGSSDEESSTSSSSSGSDRSSDSDDSSIGSSGSLDSNSDSANSGSGDDSQGSGTDNTDLTSDNETAHGTTNENGSGNVGGTDEKNENSDVSETTDLSSASGASKETKDAFIMALSMQAVSKKIYQSFDFVDEKSPTSASIPSGTEVTFSMSFDSSVDPESVKIELNNGKGAVNGDLRTWGEAFAYVFDQPADAYFQISGKSTKGNFTHRLNIPIK